MLPSNSGGTNQQIKFTLIVEAQDSIAKAREVEERLAAIKKEMVLLQQQFDVSFKSLSQGMQKAADDAARLKKPLLSQFMTGDPNDPSKQILTPENKQKLLDATNAYKEALKQASQYKKEISRASQELIKQEVSDSKKRIAAEKEVSTAQTALAKEALMQRSIANKQASQLAIADAREEAKAIRVSNLEKARSDKERAAVAIAATNEAKENYKRAIREEIEARRALAIANQAQISAPGGGANRLLENAKASVEAAKQQVAVTKAIAQDAVQHQRAVETANARMATSFLRLSNALKYAFMGGLAFGILSFFQQLPAVIMKATEAAVEFSKTQLALAVGLREMRRRSGEAPMFEEVSAQIQELQGRFKGLYSQMDLTEAYSVAISKLGRLGASFEDVNKVVETSAVLAQLNEKSLKDTSAALSTYLNSGVSQGLENTGVIVGRAADKFVAFEKGLQSATLDGIDPAAKAMLRLQFVAKQVDPQLAELAGRPLIIANSWDEANNQIKESTVGLGEAFAPFIIRFKKGWADILDFLAEKVVPMFQDVFVYIVGEVGKFTGQTIYLFAMIGEQLKRISNKEALISIKEFWTGFENAAELGAKAATKSIKEDFIKDSNDAIAAWANEDVDFMGAIIPDDEDTSKMKEFWAELFKQISDLIIDYKRDVADAWTDYQEELTEIDREYHQKRLDIEEDFQRKLADLARENQQKIEDENRKYQQQKEDVAREYNQKIADANREYHDREEEAEEEFQKKLRRLREDFLFDLEDAVRERDARQIMSLIKRYNMDRQRLVEDFQDEKEEREKNYRDQLEEIRLWRQRRLEELAIEHQRRLEEIQLEYAREQEEAARNRDRELEETEIWRQEQEDAAKLAYDRELEDLKRHFEDRMTEILTSLMEEKDIQAKYADEIAALIKKTFGPGGKIENSFDNFNKVVDDSIAKALEAMAIIQQLEEQLAIPDTSTDTTTPSTTTPDSGTLPDIEEPSDRNLPDNPNSGGPASSFSAVPPSPIGMSNIMNSTPSVTLPTSASSIAESSNQSAKIEIYLSDGLEAKITEQTMTELIEVISQVRK